MADGSRSVRGGSPGSSPLLGGRCRGWAPSAVPPGHGFRRVTLTKPTFCHYCTDFIWGLAGYQCEGKGLGLWVRVGKGGVGEDFGGARSGFGAAPSRECAAERHQAPRGHLPLPRSSGVIAARPAFFAKIQP